jgi:HAD superfamily hydrolase (TIGR01509 family)
VTAGDGSPAAVLFDLDGLLVDSEPLWTVAETEVAGRLGGLFTPEIKAAMLGHRLDTSVPILLAGLGVTADERLVGGMLLDRMVELFIDRLPLRPGAAGLLAAADRAGLPTALVSNSVRRLVDAALPVLRPHRFGAVVAGDEVRYGKPHPEPYRTAAARLGVPPWRCLVVEDSPAGATAGAAAGCAVVVVPSVVGVPPDPRWTVVPTLAEVRLFRPARAG